MVKGRKDLLHSLGHTVEKGKVSIQPFFSIFWNTDMSLILNRQRIRDRG
jgi:hypothetical protein